MSWDRIKGHEQWVLAFSRAASRNRLAHAYLFCGPPGVGKRLFAQELAKTLLCDKRTQVQFDACDHCAACALVDAGTHPDFIVAGRPEDKQELPVEVVRRLCADLALKPARGGRKIAILDDANDLNEEAANSFLKTLEEPPPGSVLILIGTSADRQLPTIRSRCQLVQFAALSKEVLRAVLSADRDLDSTVLERILPLSEGSVGLARELTDPALWEIRNRFLDCLAESKPDTLRLSRDLVATVEDAGKEAGAQRRRAHLILRLLMDGLRQALTLSVGGAASPTTEPGEKPILQRLHRRMGTDGLLRRLDRSFDAQFQIDRYVQVPFVLEAWVDALA